MEYVEIGDANREKIYRDSYRYSLSGNEVFQEKVMPVTSYCKGKFGFIHPKITELFMGKTKPWFIDYDESVFGLKGIHKKVPEVRNLTRENNLIGDYDFDPNNILVCMLSHYDLKSNRISMDLVLRPFYDEELIRNVNLPESVETKVLSAAKSMVDNEIMRPYDIPIEYLPRKINPAKLRSS